MWLWSLTSKLINTSHASWIALQNIPLKTLKKGSKKQHFSYIT